MHERQKLILNQDDLAGVEQKICMITLENNSLNVFLSKII